MKKWAKLMVVSLFTGMVWTQVTPTDQNGCAGYSPSGYEKSNSPFAKVVSKPSSSFSPSKSSFSKSKSNNSSSSSYARESVKESRSKHRFNESPSSNPYSPYNNK